MSGFYDQLMMREAFDSAVGEALSYIVNERVSDDIAHRIAVYVDWLEEQVNAEAQQAQASSVASWEDAHMADWTDGGPYPNGLIAPAKAQESEAQGDE